MEKNTTPTIVQKTSRGRKSKEPMNALLKQNSILASLIQDAVPKSLKKPRSTKVTSGQINVGENKSEFVHFKEFFNGAGLLDDGTMFQSFIEDLAQNGFADEMAKQINCKIATASHNSSFHNNIVDDIFSSSTLVNKAPNKIVFNEISNVVNEKPNIIAFVEKNPLLLSMQTVSQHDSMNNRISENTSEINGPCLDNIDFQESICLFNQKNENMPDFNDENSQNVSINNFVLSKRA